MTHPSPPRSKHWPGRPATMRWSCSTSRPRPRVRSPSCSIACRAGASAGCSRTGPPSSSANSPRSSRRSASLIDRMHAAGVVHRGIRLESVLFDRAGAPDARVLRACRADRPGAAARGARGDRWRARRPARARVDRRSRARPRRRPARGARPHRLARDEHRRMPRGLGRGACVARASNSHRRCRSTSRAPQLPVEARIPGRIPIDAPPPRKGRQPAEPARRRRRRDDAAASVAARCLNACRWWRQRVEPAADEPWHRGIPPDAEVVVPGRSRRGCAATGRGVASARSARPGAVARAVRGGPPRGLPLGGEASAGCRWRARLGDGAHPRRHRRPRSSVTRRGACPRCGSPRRLVGIALVAAIILVPQGDSGAPSRCRADSDPQRHRTRARLDSHRSGRGAVRPGAGG